MTIEPASSTSSRDTAIPKSGLYLCAQAAVRTSTDLVYRISAQRTHVDGEKLSILYQALRLFLAKAWNHAS
jgi:hypothetical protein